MAIQDAPHLLFKEYKKEHQRFTDGISRFEERFRAGETDLCLEMFEFMQTWIENYIKVFGTEAAEYMRSKGYE
jgi:hemerythrin